MRYWHKFWESFPSVYGEMEFLRQVGRVVDGKPISEELFRVIVDSIVTHLAATPTDDVLDLCCGNGIITREVARQCRSIVGVDYSSRLIEIAKKHNASRNISYVCADVMDLPVMLQGRFDKAYMYEAIQYFSEQQFAHILAACRLFAKDTPCFLVGSIPDVSKKWRFYDTLSRRCDWLKRTLTNREVIGHWWERDAIRRLCADAHLMVRFIEQNPLLHTAHYRFDVLIGEGAFATNSTPT